MIVEREICVGAETPFRIVHISDTHLCYADGRDDERKNSVAQKRSKIFTQGEETLAEASRVAKEHGTFIIHSGDLIDFVSEANLDRAKKYASENDLFISAGNHEFSLYVGESWEDAEYRNRSLARVQSCFKNDIRMSSRIINRVNFVAIDNGYYLFDREQLDFLKGEVEKGLPIVLVMHVPIYEESLYRSLRSNVGAVSFMACTPHEIMEKYTDERRYRQQMPDEVTEEFCQYVKAQPLVKAILTGHIHETIDAHLREGVPQLLISRVDVGLVTIK